MAHDAAGYVDKAGLLALLGTVRDPISGKDLVSAGVVMHAAACDGYCSAKLSSVGHGSLGTLDQLAREVHAAVDSRAVSLTLEFVNAAGRVVHQARFGVTPPGEINSKQPTPAQAAAQADASSGGHRPIPLGPSPQGTATGLPGVRHVIAVGAGKGGVGKSTVSINLAVGLARRGHAVGALDGDIYGPSFPTMLGLNALDQSVVGGRLQPFAVHGIKAITLGKLVDADKPLIWRGPMAHGAFKQLAEQTDWGELDHLVVDLPPGTGDISLTMAQTLKITGALVVCTPQRVAQDDAARAAAMFTQLGIEVLGVVENMSYFVGDDGKIYDLFGRGGARSMADRLGLTFLGEVPITMALRVNSDAGDPSANFAEHPGNAMLAASLERLVDRVEEQLALAAARQGKTRPTLKIS